jgi:hypothetical protein
MTGFIMAISAGKSSFFSEKFQWENHPSKWSILQLKTWLFKRTL